MSLAGALRWLVIAVAGAAVAALLLSGPGYRLGWWHFRVGIQLVRWAGYLGIAGTVLAIVAIAIPKVRVGWSGTLGSALLAAAVAAGLTLAWGARAKAVPPIHDISTDTENPPAFAAVLPLRAGAENTVAYGGKALAEAQRKGYPDIQPLMLAAPPEAALVRARNAAQDLGWDIVATDPAAGRLEATDTTPWFGFKDDIVVRIVPAGGGSRVDVRSVSRVGRSDIGTNARRIKAFLAKLREDGK
jgi:uncharacterized protein (DUF1499 family)